MAIEAKWDLPQSIIDLSKSNTWKRAVREWELVDIEILDGGEFETCLCGHYPIRELCHIENRKTGETAIVGNHCVAKFDKDDPGHEMFGSTTKAFHAAKRIIENPSASANKALISFAEEKGVLNESEAKFYQDVWRKRKLTEKQENYKERLNQKLLYEMVLSKRVAYQWLKENPKEGTAGPKLVEYAFEKDVIREKDRDFYMQIWNRDHDRLSDKQVSYKVSLNRRIITQLQKDLDSTKRRRTEAT